MLRDLRQDPAGIVDPAHLAQSLRMTTDELSYLTRHLYHLAPSDLLDRERISGACHFLRRSERSLDAVARSAGFADRQAFEQAFRRSQRLSPTAFRSLLGAKAFDLKLPSWLRFDDLKAYWGRDPKSVCERVQGDRLSWAIRASNGPILLRFDLERPWARCTISGPGAVDPEIAFHAHETLLRLLGLHLDPRPYEAQVQAGTWRALIAGREGWTPPQTATLFDGLVWVIAGQQVSLAAAFSIRRRLNIGFGRDLGGGWFAPPSARDLAKVSPEVLARHGLTHRKAEYLSAFARQEVETPGSWDRQEWQGLTAPEATSRLLAQRGLGPWSVGYLMMRGLGFADCVPLGDVALLRKLRRFFQLEQRPDRDQTVELMRPFIPYRSLATFHFWALPEKLSDN